MIIYPTIELKNGQCVSLTRGDIDNAQIWHVDPVKKAVEFANAGASWMHVTDIDAVAGTGDNSDLIRKIIVASGIPVQVAGGVRSYDGVERWLECGAGRVVVGTAAVLSPDIVRDAAKRHPDQIVVAMDVQRDRIMIDGWKSESMIDPADFISSYVNVPLAAVLITDVEGDIDGAEGAMGRISALAEKVAWPVIASGVVRGIDDIARLKYIGNIGGAVVGRALFNRSIDLGEAIEAAVNAGEPVADFI